MPGAVLCWQGSDRSEVNAPVVGVAAGWAPRVQISASIPRVIGDDVSGVVGGLDTTYVSANREWHELGLPISVEVDRGTARVFGSAGYFTPGVWFAGGGIGPRRRRESRCPLPPLLIHLQISKDRAALIASHS